MAEPDDKVKKLLDIKTQNQLAKAELRWDLPPREPEIGLVLALNPAGLIPKIGAAITALAPILADPKGAYETALGVMNSVRGKIGNGIANLGERVAGQPRVPANRRLENHNSNNNDNNGGGKKKWPWVVGALGAAGGAYGLFGGSKPTERNDNTTNRAGVVTDVTYDPATDTYYGRTSNGRDTTYNGSHRYPGEYTNTNW